MSTVASSSALKRKRSNAALRELMPSEGFLAASKSRDTIPDELVDDEDEGPDASPTKRSLRNLPSKSIAVSRRNGRNDNLVLHSSINPKASRQYRGDEAVAERGRGGKSQRTSERPELDEELQSSPTKRKSAMKSSTRGQSSRDDYDDDVEDSPTKARAARRRASAVSFSSEAEEIEPETPSKSRAAAARANPSTLGASKSAQLLSSPTKASPILFVTGSDPRLVRRKPSTTLKQTPKGKGKEKAADETPLRSGRKKARRGSSPGSQFDDDDGVPSTQGYDPEDQDDDDLDDDGLEENEESDEDEEGASPSKRSPSKRKSPTKKKKEPVSVTHVPGFVTQSAVDAYFQQVSIPARTSSNIFTSLLPTLASREYEELLESSPAVSKHKEELESLQESHAAMFSTYMMELTAGFNLLFYGYGSKRRTLNRFARETCSLRGDVVVLNGFKPGIGIKELLDRVDALLANDMDESGSSLTATGLSAWDARAQRIYKVYSRPGHPDLFLVLHNMDSPALRSSRAKSVLSLLASHPKIHLLGSVDHINAPLIWTKSEAMGRGHIDEPSTIDIPAGRNFTWLWHDLTTFEHYDFELRAQAAAGVRDLTSVTVSAKTGKLAGALLAGGGPAANAGPLTEEGARQVLTSVTERSRKLFALIAMRQLETADAADAQNVTASQMSEYAASYEWMVKAAREAFIATSEQALRGLLQEFKDHGMVVIGAGPAGAGDIIWVPLAKNILQRISETPTTEE